MDFWKSIEGMLEMELCSADIGAAFSSVNHLNIPVYQVRYVNDLTVRFHILRKDLRKVVELYQKRGETLRILKYKGVYWAIHGLLRRPALLLGLIMLLCCALYVPAKVLFIQVEGNASVPARKILAAAEECGIRFGADRRNVRSEKVKNALLSAVPELQWAGVNTSGCVATISVKERTDPPQEDTPREVSSIVASRDGIIYTCTATRGNLLVSPGQAVKEGQLLISGYTDCGLTIQATRAEGEIMAQTSHKQTVVMPSQYMVKGEKTNTKRKYSILIGKKRINLWNNSGIWDATYDRMYEEYDVTLPGGYRLPLALCIEEYVFRDIMDSEIPQAEAEETLLVFAKAYLTEQMVAGNILHKSQTVVLENGSYRLDGHYICTEMIGRVQQEQIGEENGKSD